MKSNGEVDECFQMLLTYSEGRAAILSGAFNQIGNAEVEIVGEEGKILIGPEFWHPTTAKLILNNGKKNVSVRSTVKQDFSMKYRKL